MFYHFFLILLTSSPVQADDLSWFEWPALELFALFFSLIFFKNRNLISGILGILSGTLSAFWMLILLQDKPSADVKWMAILLIIQWLVLIIGLFRPRFQKR